MGVNQMPTVADFLKIQPVTPELIRELGYLPQCTFWDRDPNHPRGCWRQSEWTIDANYRCTTHKDEAVRLWEMIIEGLTKRPTAAQDSDLELLELIRDELEPKPSREIYSRVAVTRVVKDLSLPDTPEGRSLASWYLWKMGIFDIHQRSKFYEQS